MVPLQMVLVAHGGWPIVYLLWWIQVAYLFKGAQQPRKQLTPLCEHDMLKSLSLSTFPLQTPFYIPLMVGAVGT